MSLFLIPVFIYIGSPTTTIDEVVDKSPAKEASLQSGDKIKEINGEILTDDLEDLLKYKGSVFCFMSCASIYHIEEKFINLLKNSV